MFRLDNIVFLAILSSLNSNFYQKIDASALTSEYGIFAEINGATKIEIIAKKLVVFSFSILIEKECQIGETLISNIVPQYRIALNGSIYEISDATNHQLLKVYFSNSGELIALDTIPNNITLRGYIIYSIYN